MTRKNVRATSRQVSASAPRVQRQKNGVTLDTQLEKRLHAAVCHYGNNYELGKLAGVSADVLSRFARKERNLRLDTAGRLAKVLGLTLTDEA
jgi:transcriptional regulator with XRE-family HTH domain